MKSTHWIVVIVALGAAAAGAVTLLTNGREPSAAVPNPAVVARTPAASALGVRDLMQDIGRYVDQPELRVAGIVSGVDPAGGAFAMIDLAEFAECGTTTCATLTLPVSWQAELAASVGQKVEVTGRIERRPDGLVFAANRVEAASASATQGGS